MGSRLDVTTQILQMMSSLGVYCVPVLKYPLLFPVVVFKHTMNCISGSLTENNY